MEIRAFEDLEVFQRAYKLSLEIHRETLKMPQIEQYALADQMRRASKSICVNLAEGFAKQAYSVVEFKRFIQMSIGSAARCAYGCATAMILGTSTLPHGSAGATNTRRSPRCCKVSIEVGNSAGALFLTSVL